MYFNHMIGNIKSKEDFMKFLIDLRDDKESNNKEWKNREITSYLEGICSWVEDMEGYFQNINTDMPENIDWKFIATLFYVGKIYE